MVEFMPSGRIGAIERRQRIEKVDQLVGERGAERQGCGDRGVGKMPLGLPCGHHSKATPSNGQVRGGVDADFRGYLIALSSSNWSLISMLQAAS